MERAEYEQKLIENVIYSIEKHGGRKCLSSIILTGSFGRGEPTYIVDREGNVQLKSDVEIALVFLDSAKKEVVNKLIAAVSSEFQEDLNLMPISERRVRNAYNFNFSVKVPKYKTAFTYDLFKGSKTIWGEDFIGKCSITLNDIDPYEAKRLVANRIGELVYLQGTAVEEEKEYLRIQWKGKLMLAIVSAWLICEKKYVSAYHGQYNIILELKADVEKLLGSDFVDDYKRVFAFLRESGTVYEVPDNKLRSYVNAINSYFKTCELKNPKVNSISRITKYYIKYVRAGIGYGLVHFENGILQALIDEYVDVSDKLINTADVWHRVLY